MNLRPVSVADGPAVLALIADCDATYSDWLPGWRPPEVPNAWPSDLLDDDHWTRGVWIEDALAGFIALHSSWEKPRYAHVRIVMVHPSFWRRGIARGMLAAADDIMRARGFAAAHLWTPEGAPAERLYTALGWTRDGRRRWHDWLGLTVVGYEKPIPPLDAGRAGGHSSTVWATPRFPAA